MSQGEFVKISNVHEIEQRLPFIVKKIKEWDYSSPLCIKYSVYSEPRTVSQNKLFHLWCKQLSAAFIKKAPNSTPENMKMILKFKFLGVEDLVIGKTIIKNQVKHSSDLDKGEMCFFLDQIYHWAVDLGVFLLIPEQSEYAKLKQKQEL